jgi:D-xylulose reductase
MKALVLERKGELSLRDIDLSLKVGPDDVKIAIHTVGICGSDIHYYTHGRIGHYVVDAPMVWVMRRQERLLRSAAMSSA